MDATIFRSTSYLTRPRPLARGSLSNRAAAVPHCRTPAASRTVDGKDGDDWNVKMALIAAIASCSLVLQPPAIAQANVATAPTTTPPATELPAKTAGAPITTHEAPSLTDGDADRWWEHDAESWLELTSENEVQSFLAASSSQSDAKLKLVELYATWCPACRAASPGLAAVAGDPSYKKACTFARANADRVKPVLRQYGVKSIPTAIIFDANGNVLDIFRASGDAVKEFIRAHAADAKEALTSTMVQPPSDLENPADFSSPSSGNDYSRTSSGNTSSSSSSMPLLQPGSSGGSVCITPEMPCGVPVDATDASLSPGHLAGSRAQSGGDFAEEKAAFLKAAGSAYGYNGWLEAHYQEEVGKRLGQDRHYLDYTGSALYPQSLLNTVVTDLASHAYGNPHSGGMAGSRSAAASEDVLQRAADKVLQHLNADPAEYQVIFTRSATEALRMVGETFPWSGSGNGNAGKGGGSSTSTSSNRGQFVYTRSNHNSVLGIGSYALAAGAELQMVPDAAAMDAWIHQQSIAAPSSMVQQQGPHSLLKWSLTSYGLDGNDFGDVQGLLEDFDQPWTPPGVAQWHLAGVNASTGQQQQPQDKPAPRIRMPQDEYYRHRHLLKRAPWDPNMTETKPNIYRISSLQPQEKPAPRIRMPQNEYYRHRHLLKRAPWDPKMTETKPNIYKISDSMSLPGYAPYSNSNADQSWLTNTLLEEDMPWSPAVAAWGSPLGPPAVFADDVAVPISSIPMASAKPKPGVRYNLVAYPAEDNYAGVIYPLEWINQIHAASTPTQRNLVLLDAAAYVPTHKLDLKAAPADFVAMSFYKTFGYPTGLGALVLRTDVVPMLQKVYFGGGSVSLATAEGCWHALKCEPAEALTDGTPDFLGAAALLHAYDFWDSSLGGMEPVEAHTQVLTKWTVQQLSSLRHSNGSLAVQLHGTHNAGANGPQGQLLGNKLGQGSIINFQVLQPDGKPISYSKVEQAAAANGIDLRSGCMCNPGACYDALGLKAEEVQSLAGKKEGCGDEMDFITVLRPAAGLQAGKAPPAAQAVGAGASEELVPVELPLGSLRASLGWASTFEDCHALVQFIKNTYVQ